MSNLIRRHAILFLLAAVVLAPTALAAEEEVSAVSEEEVSAAPEEKAQAPEAPAEFLKDGQLDLDAVVDYFEDLYRSDSSISEATLQITRPRMERSMSMKIWTKGEEKALIQIMAPPREEGTTTLKVEDNLWNYFPRIDRTIRIPPSMMLASWMGSDFTNDDLVRESSYREDYTYELAGKHEDPEGWLIRFNAKPDTVGLWEKFEVVMSPEGTIPLQASYYDRKGQLARTLTWDQVGEFDGKVLPARMTLIPVDEEGHKTVFTYENLDFDVDIPESKFSLSALESRQ